MLQRPGAVEPPEETTGQALEDPSTNPTEVVHPDDPIRSLQEKINSGAVELAFEENGFGYFRSLLQALNVPVSSQSLVFGKNSAQLDLISPERPRAVYFNDDVYLGFVQAGSFIEVASIDPKNGPVFWSLDQEKRQRPVFVRQMTDCLACHDSGGDGVPRLLVLSTFPDPTGVSIGRRAFSVADSTPFEQRFGGWYVTGSHGNQVHMGNVHAPLRTTAIPDQVAYTDQVDLNGGGNVTDLRGRFDTTQYVSGHSDIVAQMVLAHQTHVHNVATRALSRYRQAIEQRNTGKELEEVVKTYSESIVEAMLFTNAIEFTAPISGTTNFASEFSAIGPRDSKGRSLRDLDLKKRLMRYPMSYVIYTQFFDELEPPIKDYVYRRFAEVLAGADKTAEFAHLSAADRQAVSEILKETKPDFVAYLNR